MGRRFRMRRCIITRCFHRGAALNVFTTLSLRLHVVEVSLSLNPVDTDLPVM
jgi:hypothetical protein